MREGFPTFVYGTSNVVHFAEKEFDDWNKLKGEVFEVEEKSEIVSCTCPLGLEHKFCKNKVGLIIKNKIISVPESLMILPIGTKNMRERPKKLVEHCPLFEIKKSNVFNSILAAMCFDLVNLTRRFSTIFAITG